MKVDFFPETLQKLKGSDPVATSAGIGDINSQAIGSGARYNAGKPPMELLPLRCVVRYIAYRSDITLSAEQRVAVACLDRLAVWQETGDTTVLVGALDGLTDPLVDAARVFEYGRKKYASWNWAKGMAWSVPFACAVRHLLAILDGEKTDPESGHPHEGHVACNLMMLITYADTYPEGDDRPRNLAPRPREIA
jgi:hypothetical protein